MARGKVVALATAMLVGLGTWPATAASPERHPTGRVEPQADAAPRIQPREAVIDFGEIDEGKEATVRFRFTNVGGAPLRVGPIEAESVLAYCGLPGSLDASQATPLIPPGGEGEIVATFHSQGFSGPIERTVDVYSNDITRPRVTFRLRGRVVPAVTVVPRQLVLGVLYKGEYPWKLPTVEVTPPAAVDVVEVESSSPLVRARLAGPPAAEGGARSLSIDIDAAVPVGDLRVELTLHTNHPRRKALVLPVTGEIREDRPIVAQPQFVDFGLVKPTREATRRIVLSRGGREDWKPLRAEVKARGATVSITFRSAKPNWEMALAVRPTGRLEGFRGLVQVVTESPTQPRIEIPFLGWTYEDSATSVPPDRLKEFVASILDDEYLQEARGVFQALGGPHAPRAFAILSAILREGESVPWIRGAGGLAGLGRGKWLARVRAAGLLAETGDPEAAARLDAAARNDPDGVVRMEAIQALYGVAGARAFATILHGLDDEAVWVRLTSAQLLGQLGDPRAIPGLLRAMEDEQRDVQLSAAEAVQAIVSRAGASGPTP